MADDNPETPPVKRGPGRPRKSELEKVAKPGKVGRPKGTAAIIKEYTNRMVASPKSAEVLKAVFEVAMDPEHKHWPAASKMVMDRVAPMAEINREIDATGGKPQIHIKIEAYKDVNIGGDTAESKEVIESTVEDIEDAQYEECDSGGSGDNPPE